MFEIQFIIPCEVKNYEVDVYQLIATPTFRKGIKYMPKIEGQFAAISRFSTGISKLTV